jgi:Fungal chitosanase of glycosyl hydrolase group 75
MDPIRENYRPDSRRLWWPYLNWWKDQCTLVRPFYRPSRFVCKLPHGELYFDSQLAADNDGSPLFTRKPSPHPPPYHDRHHQSETAWQPHGKNLDANEVPFIALPIPFFKQIQRLHRSGFKLGDIAAVFYKDVEVYAVLGDVGGELLGEGSIALHRDLGHELIYGGAYHDESIERDVITILFPGTSNEDVATRETIQQRGRQLVDRLIRTKVF